MSNRYLVLHDNARFQRKRRGGQRRLQFLLARQLRRRMLVEAVGDVQTALLLEGEHVREEPSAQSAVVQLHHQGTTEGAVLHLRRAVEERVHDVQDGKGGVRRMRFVDEQWGRELLLERREHTPQLLAFLDGGRFEVALHQQKGHDGLAQTVLAQRYRAINERGKGCDSVFVSPFSSARLNVPANDLEC